MKSSALFTDLYQLTMAEAYLSAKKADARAVFELFFRKCPFSGEYAVVAGYDLIRDIVENFKFTEHDIDYLKTLPSLKHLDQTFFGTLSNLDLSDIEIWGVKEGEIVFPRIPLLQIRGPVLKAQLLESAFLNAVNFATLVATYARRIRMVASPQKQLVEFGLRRAQGPNGAMTATRASYIGGFDSTSNVLAGHNLQIPVAGTMAHSFIQSFWAINDTDLEWKSGSIRNLIKEFETSEIVKPNQGELGAFIAYAKAFPDNCLLLVDTYDTLQSGVPNAIHIFKILRKLGHTPIGIRLDSGDLVYLSKETRRLLDAAGFTDVKIFASNELDETVIDSLQDQGAEIDAYGVGTRLVTASKDPALGGVYKLVELDGQPRLKISQQTEKLIVPGCKQVYRLWGSDGTMLLDLICLESEEAPKVGTEISALHPSDPFKKALVTPTRVEALLKPLFMNGKWLEKNSLAETRIQSLDRMKALRSDISRRSNPTPHKVSVSQKLKTLLDELYLKEKPHRILK